MVAAARRPGRLLAEELLEERIGRNVLLAVDVFVIATTDDFVRLTALTIRSWSLTPLSGTAATAGGVRPGPATPPKCVLA